MQPLFSLALTLFLYKYACVEKHIEINLKRLSHLKTVSLSLKSHAGRPPNSNVWPCSDNHIQLIAGGLKYQFVVLAVIYIDQHKRRIVLIESVYNYHPFFVTYGSPYYTKMGFITHFIINQTVVTVVTLMLRLT